MFKKLSINTKIFAGFGLTIILLTFFTVTAFVWQSELESSHEKLYKENFSHMFDFVDLKANINAARLDVAVMLDIDRSQWEVWQKDLEMRVKNIDKINGRLSAGLADDPGIKARFDKFLDVYERFASTGYNFVLPQLNKGQIEEAKRLFTGVQLQRHLKMREILDGLADEEQADALEKLASNQRKARLYTALFGGLGALAVLISLAMAYFLSRVFRTYLAQREQAEKALKESERMFRLINETIEDVFWMNTPGVTRLIYISPAYEKIWKKSRESLYENPISFMDRVHPEDKAMLADIIRQYHSNGRPYQCEYRIVEPDGSVEWIAEKGFPAYDDKGGLLCMTGTSAVVTERKMAGAALEKSAEELDRSNKELEQFAYIISHDLQEPLRMIASFLHLLARKYEGKLDEAASEYINYAVDGAERLQMMISDLLEYSRVQTQTKPLEEAEAQSLLQIALGNLRSAIAESGARVDFDALPRIYVDRSQFARLFQNLIGNAIKFRKPGEPPRIRVSAKDNGNQCSFP